MGFAEDRGCVMRREGNSSAVISFNGQYVGGIFCPEKLRGQGLATSLLRHIRTDSSYGDHTPQSFLGNETPEPTRTAAMQSTSIKGIFLLQKSATANSSFIRPVVTPDICRLQIPFLPDNTMDLPSSFENVDTSNVRFMNMDDAAAALRRYEGVVRRELETPSELDRFCALPDSQSDRLT